MKKHEMNVTIHPLEVPMDISKESALNKIVHLLTDQQIIEDGDLFLKEALKREEMGNTHIGHGAALVHLIHDTVKQEGIYLYDLRNPISNWYMDETHPIRFIIVYAISQENSDNLKYFRKFSSLCGDDEFMEQLVHQRMTIEKIKKYLF
ncbi:PTS sugar transporter subunit IIA [Niallia sp. Krafla_26]|uniref:PTS sugar transporter subunit IIA n=1 Tax=Niallia sp. Krafla_26 TaxID=3064703 RepID=UPI003D174D2A